MIDAAEKLARFAFSRTDIADVPPIDVEQLAIALGITEIRAAPLTELGRLIFTPTEQRILVRGGLSAERRRFTIAHEIGHLLLMEEAFATGTRRHAWDSSREERFCDEFATAVLMPTDWLRNKYLGAPQSLSSLRVAATESRVSLGASVIRLHDVLGWERGLVRWRRQDGNWRLAELAAVPTWARRLCSSALTSAALSDYLSRGRDYPVAAVPIRVGDLELMVRGELSFRGNTVLIFSDRRQFAFRPHRQMEVRHEPVA